MKNKADLKKITCLGAGYVGGPTMAVMADRCNSIEITIVDLNQSKVDLWNSEDLSNLPVFEPGLASIIKKVRGKNLFFSSDIQKAISEADIIFISVNTPTKTSGYGAGFASDLKWVESSARTIANFATGHTIVVEKSTVPVKTAEVIKTILNYNQNYDAKKSFSILSNPEFLAEGTAINDLENPDRVLIGGNDSDAIESLSLIYEHWVSKEKIIKTNLWSSELSKLAANAFLAQRISSINAIGAICESTGANVREVKLAIGSDKRIGERFLNAGPGFGGSCFQKDLLNMVYLSKYYGLNEVANYWEQVLILNNWQKSRISKLVVDKLFGTLNGKKIAILGFAFKANTNDTRESSAIKITKELLTEGAEIVIHDPKVTKDQIKKDLEKNEGKDPKQKESNSFWWFSKDYEEIFKNSDAIIILTEWEEYKTLNWKFYTNLMRKPSWIFDSRSIVNPKEMKNLGIKLWRIGDGTLD
ncbi:nucleotide sugar dehydrogenase [Prochlorococcus marinus XMU1406]|uniref:nucleotide sugar dehydrogenase n=1 Tax=Prochlorococcus marinus TaxID=1219 RepID=UPI001ADBC341|nr:nucleotide sugar dehydrogenase [Prochlorococcus marinus]MBO8206804.1 nucleotide sugar dehydrogenase [Prochlorococcus marinus XMU1406]MCR8542623.1 nucleotide sugar dehydrogenase [Prochlorococcus marinus XMU1427]